MEDLLNNPVYNALCSKDSILGSGTALAKYFDEAVSPFAGFAEHYENGFSELYDLLPIGRKILFATPFKIAPPAGWLLQHEIGGLQFVYNGIDNYKSSKQIIALRDEHVNAMIDLVKLTRPGPFGKRTIDFGSYFGIFDQGKLVAMTGQRLHVQNHTEVSAVCTHPDYLGKGYASALLQHQLNIILQHGQQPFLHVRDDNARAIAVYERLGFAVSRPMNFYFLKRE